MHPKLAAYIRTNKRIFKSGFRLIATRVSRAWHERRLGAPKGVPTAKENGLYWEKHPRVLPHEAYPRNFCITTEALTKAGIDWWTISWADCEPFRIGISDADKDAALAAWSSNIEQIIYVRAPEDAHFTLSAKAAREAPRLLNKNVWQVGTPLISGSKSYSLAYGCVVESWNINSEDNYVYAPRENRASRQIDRALISDRVTIETRNQKFSTLGILNQRMVDDITFPIDVVYTWVDGSDEEWQAQRAKAWAQEQGLEYHPEAIDTARFRDRGELKYSLRSLDMYAPWVNHIYIVTSGQVPAWLNTNHPKITLVTHHDIYPDDSYLPVFNSNSIISRLHHIPNLSEHYIYFNDDVMLTGIVKPKHFFYGNGIARVFASNNRRPFSAPTAEEEPHFNISKNIRTLLQQDQGITISRAIKHTPHAQLKSVHLELEQRFTTTYEQTWRSKFRHHTDIVADQLHHYYAQITGKAIPATFNYQYVNLLDDNYERYFEALKGATRKLSVCVNDAPVEGATPIDAETVAKTFEALYPFRSTFER